MSGLTEAERFDKETEARKTLAQVLGGLVILVTFYSAYQSLISAQQQVRLVQEQVRIATEAQITDRFARSATGLGDRSADVRIASIYALERISKDSERDYWTIMEILSSFIHNRSPWPSKRTLSGLPEDINAALEVLARRNPQNDPDDEFLVLENCDLRHAYLAYGHLEGILLDGSHLEGATLDHASFDVDSSLDRCHLEGAHLIAVSGLTQEQINLTFGDAKTVLPNDLKRPLQWMK